MAFASSYLHKHSIFQPFINQDPHPDTSLIVVIPSFNEPDVLTSLVSLFDADRPAFPVEVIIVVNSPEDACERIIEQNRKTVLQIRKWSSRYSSCDFMVYVIDVPPFPRRHAGAGFARKTGMDEALHRFNLLNNKRGIIVSFDADSSCDSTYFTELEKCFSFSGLSGCTIYFEHPVCGDEQTAIVYKAIIEYELYLRYFVQALRQTGFPWAFHTIGSCFAVNAQVYALQGGMNRKTAGEDFYFLHKIFPLGNFTELNTTRVVPSSRVSDRVPFGTGATMKSFAIGNQTELQTYPFESFEDISLLFAKVPEFFGADEDEVIRIVNQLPDCIGKYLLKNDFISSAGQMNLHSASFKTFRKRFFIWFNAFRSLKFLNYARDNCRENQPVTCASGILLEKLGISCASGSTDLLFRYRELQRSTVWKC